MSATEEEKIYSKLNQISEQESSISTYVGDLNFAIETTKSGLLQILEKLKSINKKLSEQNDLTPELQKLQGKNQEYSSQIEALSTELSKVKNELSTKTSEIEDKTKQIEQSSVMFTQSQQQLESLKSEIATQLNEIERLNESNKTLTTSNDEEKQRLITENKELNRILTQVTEQLGITTETIKDNTERIIPQLKENVSLQQEITELRRRYDILMEEVNKLITKILGLQASIMSTMKEDSKSLLKGEIDSITDTVKQILDKMGIKEQESELVVESTMPPKELPQVSQELPRVLSGRRPLQGSVFPTGSLLQAPRRPDSTTQNNFLSKITDANIDILKPEELNQANTYFDGNIGDQKNIVPNTESELLLYMLNVLAERYKSMESDDRNSYNDIINELIYFDNDSLEYINNLSNEKKQTKTPEQLFETKRELYERITSLFNETSIIPPVSDDQYLGIINLNRDNFNLNKFLTTTQGGKYRKPRKTRKHRKNNSKTRSKKGGKKGKKSKRRKGNRHHTKSN